jgi:hypothetical protein
MAAHLILDRGEWSASRPGRFAPGREPPVGEGPLPGLDALEKESREPTGMRTPGRSARLVANVKAQIVTLVSIFMCLVSVFTATNIKPQSIGILDSILLCF